MKTVEIEIPIGYKIDKEKSTFEKIVFKKIKSEWIDLGLPSGNLWKNVNENGYFTYNDAVEKFKDNLPTIVDFAELIQYCKWEWSPKSKGMIVTGPNKNQIIFLALGYQDIDYTTPFNTESEGCYWSASPTASYCGNAYFLNICSGIVQSCLNYTRDFKFSVHCVKHK